MILVALVLRSQFQEVVARSNGRKVSLFQLTLLEKAESPADGDDGLLVFKIWGNAGKDRLRHRIGRGSIVAIEETNRRIDWRNNANEGTIIDGDLIAFSEINSDEICAYELNPAVHMDYMVRSRIAESAKELLNTLGRSERWALLRSCACRSFNKASLHAILSDSKALLFNVDLVIPLESFFNFDDFKVRDSDGDTSKLSFKDSMARENFVAQVTSALRSLPLFLTFIDHLKDALVMDNGRPPQKPSDMLKALETCLSDILKRDCSLLDRVILNESVMSESSSLRRDFSLKFHFQNLAVLSSYNRRITALQFLSHETSLSVTSDAITAHLHRREHLATGISSNTDTNERLITREVPDIKFISWKNMLPLLTTLPLDNVGMRDVDEEYEHGSFPQDYFLFCGYVHGVEFFGNEPDTFYNNIQCQQSLVGSIEEQGNGGDWSFRDATISLSASPSTLPNAGCQKIDDIEEIERRLCSLMHDRCFLTSTGRQLQTQCPFSFQSLPSSLLESTGIAACANGGDIFNTSTFRARDLIFALAEGHSELSNPMQPLPKGGHHTIAADNPPPLCQLVESQESYPPISTPHHLLYAPSQYPTYPEPISMAGHANKTAASHLKKRKIRDEELPAPKKQLFSQSSVHWRYTIPSTFTADQTFTAPTADTWNNEKKLTLLMTHDFQQKRLFHGISPLVLALDLYRQVECPDSSHSVAKLSPVKKCVDEIQRLRALSTTSHCLLFVARLLPSVDDDGGFTGEMLLSLEDIL